VTARAPILAWLLALAPALATAQAATSPPAGPPAASSAPDTEDSDLDARIRASAEAAEALQGPLDGAWTLVTGDGRPLYAFEFVDKPGGLDPVEGVWRDLRRPPAPGDIGLIDTVTRGAGSLSLSFIAHAGDPPVVIDLTNGSGRWVGRLREGPVLLAVMMRRN